MSTQTMSDLIYHLETCKLFNHLEQRLIYYSIVTGELPEMQDTND